MRASPFVSFCCWNDFSRTTNAKCTAEQKSQTFCETHTAYAYQLSPGPRHGEVPPRGESESAAPPNKKCRPAPQKRDGNSCIIIIIINGLF